MELSPFKKETLSHKISIYKEWDPTIYAKMTWIPKVSGMTHSQIQIQMMTKYKTCTASKRDGVGSPKIFFYPNHNHNAIPWVA